MAGFHPPPALHAACRAMFTIRMILKAAEQKTKIQLTRLLPRYLSFLSPPIVFIQPKIASIRFRLFWLTS